MWQIQTHFNSSSSSFKESLKSLESDLQHANSLAATLRQDYDGDCVQMKLSYSPLAPFLIFIIEWMDYTCTDSFPTYLGLLHILVYKIYVDGMPTISTEERKASLREFYAVIYPSLKQLKDSMIEITENNNKRSQCSDISSKKGLEEKQKQLDSDSEREDECSICMETGTRMVLPNCGHSMCGRCFHDWNVRSQSCPFCRGSLKTVSSEDLWVLTSKSDATDMVTLAKENLRCFYLYIQNLPLVVSDTHLLLFEYLI